MWYDAGENYHRSEIHCWARSARTVAHGCERATGKHTCRAVQSCTALRLFSLHALNGRECSKWDFLLFYLCDCNESITVIFLFDKQITSESSISISMLYFREFFVFLLRTLAHSRIIEFTWILADLQFYYTNFTSLKEQNICEFDTLFCQLVCIHDSPIQRWNLIELETIV